MGDHEVGTVDAGSNLICWKSLWAVVDHYLHVRDEPRCLRGPVSDHRRRSDHQTRLLRTARSEMGKQSWRLSESHVESETTTESCIVKESEPRNRFSLVATQFTCETVGSGRRLRDLRCARQQISGPAATTEGYASAKRRTFDPECVAQHRRARHRRLISTFGDGPSSLGEVCVLERYPFASRPHHGPSLEGQTLNLLRGRARRRRTLPTN